jgi:hypothetical protein
MAQRKREAKLGVLQLENKPMLVRGCLNTSETFGFAVAGRIVPGARVDNTVPGDPSRLPAWIETARALEAEGVAAITSNCGFALRYQAALAAATAVPVSVSSLNLLAYVLRGVPAGGKVAVLTYDSRHFDAGLFALAGVAGDAARIVIAGIEGTRCYELMLRPDNPATVEDIQTAVLEAAQGATREDKVGAFLFECAGFGPASDLVRERTSVPVWDAVDNARLLMMGAVGAAAFPHQQ